MSATISVTKEKLKKFFEDSQQNPLLIPEYQRPYEWGCNEITTLFNDLKEFAETDKSDTDEYFLGAVVHYNNAGNQREIIDGHQRLVSLTLLLRAIYAQLELTIPTAVIERNKIQLEPLLWKTNQLGETDKSTVLIQSKVIGEQTEKIFFDILKTGIADPDSKDMYSQNYLLLRSLYREYYGHDALSAIKFINQLLNQVIVLPIQAESQDMALNIFSTLNTRGKPLTEADILKSKIYKLLDVDARQPFISHWQNIEERAAELEKDIIEDIFTPYMFYTRALDGWTKLIYSTARKYFLNERSEYLSDPNLMSMLDHILNLWEFINQHNEIVEEPWSQDKKIIQAFEILVLYPQDFWKNAVITYYLANRSCNDFGSRFLLFLRKLISQIVPRCFIRRAIDTIKYGIITANIESIKTPYPTFNFRSVDGLKDFTNNIRLKAKSPNPIKMLLKILAYADEEQISLLPDTLQIEHIYPRKWVDNYDLNGFTPDKINDLVETLGNLTLFEKKHNIRASNEYFAKKKKSYKQSKVAMTRQLIELSDFRPDNIITRTEEMTRRLKTILSTWSDEYDEAKRIYDRQYGLETLR